MGFEKKILYIFAGLLAVLIAGGCASGTASVSSDDMPEWISVPPADTADTVYFLGAGSSSSGDEAEARSMAGSDMVSSVTRFLGVKVSSETTVTARDELEQFTSSLAQVIKESSSALISDFRVAESFTQKKGQSVSVYLLGAYRKEALLEERTRIKAVFAEQINAVSGPEGEGDLLMESGSFYEAAVRYIAAASAAYASEIDNAAIRYERNMTKARDAVSGIYLYALNDNLNAFIKQPFEDSFRMKITGTPGIDGKALSGVPVKVVYKIVRDNGRKTVRSEVLVSDNDGIVVFTREPANFVGTERVTMSLDLSSPLESLKDVPDSLYPQLESLEKAVNSKSAGFTYNVISRAKEIATAVMIMDVDNSGAFTGKTETASGVLEVLTAEGFSIRTIDLDKDILNNGDDIIIKTISERYPGQFERIIYGKVAINDFQEDSGRFTVRVSGDIKVADLGTGEILYTSGSRFKTAMGSNVASAMSTAFKQFGKAIGESMANSLP